MIVKLFKLGGHEYVFHFGLTRKGEEKPIKKQAFSKKRNDLFVIPQNKYSYKRDDVSRHIGLKKYANFMERIAEILEVIPETPQRTSLVTDKLKDILPNIEPSHLNLIARVHENNPLEDTHKQKWLLVSSSWGNSSQIYKKKFVGEKQ